MSGFEVAGVILGTIPLIISALEHYEQTYLVANKWRYYKRELHSITENLENERVRLQNSCEILLDGLGLDPQIESLVDDLSNPAWTEPRIQRKIEARLGRSYNAFERSVRDVERATAQIKKRLDIQPDGKIGWLEASFVTREVKRATFALKRSRYADLMAAIENGITKIEHAVAGNIRTEPRRKLRFQGKLITLLRTVSSSMYRALRANFTCCCSHEMQLSLCLPTFGPDRKNDLEEVVSKLDFRLRLTYAINAENGDHVEQLEWPGKDFLLNASPPGQAPVYVVQPIWRSSPGQPNDNNSAKKKRKGVSFAGASPAECFNQTSLPFKALSKWPQSSTEPPAFRTFPDTVNLCQVARGSHSQSYRFGFGTISEGTSPACWGFRLRLPTKSRLDDSKSVSIVSLKQILERPRLFSRMNQSAKLQLATTIASSFLQLHQTPWVPDILSSQEIMFLATGSTVGYSDAFVKRRLPEIPDQPRLNETTLSYETRALRSLGILLFELNMGQTLEKLRLQREDECEDSIMEEMMMSREKWNGSYDEVVRLCLWGDCGRELDLNKDTFRQEIYERVVAPLETDLERVMWSFTG